MPDLSIIIPARNEEENIVKTIEGIENSVRVDCELIVVNDHSTDKTNEFVENLSARYRNIIAVDNKDQAGFVRAFLCGVKNSNSPVLVLVMADLCDDPGTINRMYAKIKEGYDIVVGSRYMPGGERIGGPRLKKFFSSFMGKALYFLIGIPTHDAPNAFKMYRRSIIENIKVESQGFEVSAEISLKAFFKGAKITEVSTVWKERNAGKSHFNMAKTGPGYICLFLWALLRRLRS